MNKKLLILLGLTAYAVAIPHNAKRRFAQAKDGEENLEDFPEVNDDIPDDLEDFPTVIDDNEEPVIEHTSIPPQAPGGSGSILACDCELPVVPGSGFPAPGQGVYNGFGNGAQVSQATSVVTVPDTAYTSQCESACCACNAGVHASEAAATRSRHYEISGAITVAETVEYIEAGKASEQSAGHS